MEKGDFVRITKGLHTGVVGKIINIIDTEDDPVYIIKTTVERFSCSKDSIEKVENV